MDRHSFVCRGNFRIASSSTSNLRWSSREYCCTDPKSNFLGAANIRELPRGISLEDEVVRNWAEQAGDSEDLLVFVRPRITSYNVCYTKLLRLDVLSRTSERPHNPSLRHLTLEPEILRGKSSKIFERHSCSPG